MINQNKKQLKNRACQSLEKGHYFPTLIEKSLFNQKRAGRLFGQVFGTFSKKYIIKNQNKKARYQLAAIGLQEGNTEAMSAALNSVATDFSLTDLESQEITDITSYFDILNQLRAENRTALELNAEVQNADENEGFLLRNELISTSPYLSTEVLETAGNQEEVLTNPLLRDILVANPQSAKSEEVLSTVDNRTNPMPDYMKQQILNGQTYVAQKELLEAKLQTEKTEYSNAQIFVISKFLNDTSINPMDSLKPLLLSSKNPEAYFQLAGIYLIEGNFTETTNILNSIPVNFNLNNQQQEELSDITAFYGLLSTIYGENRSLNELNNAEMQDIWDWYNNENNNVVSVWARNILLFLGELEHTPEIVLPETDNNKSSLIKKPFNVEVPTDEYGSLKLYPNPTKDYIICNYKIMISYKNAYLLITESSSGKTKSTIVLNKDADQKTIDLSSFNSGNYILTLIIDDIEINSKKFSIIK